MTQTDDFLSDTTAFTDLVDTPGADWHAASPCDDWTAADVVGHVIDTQRDFLQQRGADLGPEPAGTPAERWHAHLDPVRRALADEAFAGSEYDGFFGRTTIADTMARFYGFDLLVHRWDLARALGRETAWSTAQMDRIDTALDGFGDHLYAEGICAPALDVPDDAPRQARLLARMGRAG
ncbi:MAG: maleylpyruvate isomerase family mycothiol-dependent enzyme [Nocardioides sp.]|jgi:uncharacterized protein (TIGR03086 family)